MKKILVVFGTRPEAIKLAPVIKLLKKEKSFKTIVCSLGQHKEMVKQVLDIFKLKVDYDLNIMKKDQDLFEVTSNSIKNFKKVLEDVCPNLIVVQGDTSTAFTSSLSAFYKKIKIAHVEAGLRSNDIFHPYPEEANRRFISVISKYHFAPTKISQQNLLMEGIPKENIFVTGNTVIDAINEAKKKIENKKSAKNIERSLNEFLPKSFFNKKFILLTLHRREKFGEELEKMLYALKDIAKTSDYNFVYPVHLNPNVQNPVKNILKNISNFYLLTPLDYLSFIYLMSKCYFILTDSGGIQEECYIFKKPVIVMRDVTERDEAVKAGYAFLTGSDDKKIKQIYMDVDKKSKDGFNFFSSKNPFGDGRASKRIVNILKNNLI